MTQAASQLRMIGIRKSFGDVVALADVDFTVEPREIHGLLGGNGAGKTTLMNVLYGLYAADAGTIEIDGRAVTIGSPSDAIDAGVGMVHQSFLQVDPFTVTENIALGMGRSPLRLDLGPARTRVRELSERFGLEVDPDAVVADLPVGVRQRVEILKALYRGARILILDEPTTNLTPQEVDALFSSMRAIVDEGMTVILITHKIRETMAVCDRMTVMQSGRWVATTARDQTTADELAAMMIGRSSKDGDSDRHHDEMMVATGVVESDELQPDGAEADSGDAHSGDADSGDAAGLSGASPRLLVEVTGLSAQGDLGGLAVSDIALRLLAGEVVGVAGVAGNGQVELAEAVSGVRRLRTGAVKVDGQTLTGAATADWLEAGVTYVPEDRQRDGILPSASIVENLLLGTQRQRARRGIINWAAARRDADNKIEQYSVQTPSATIPAGQLSGGNIQRVILARAFAHHPKLLVLHNPTRGLDITSTAFVHDRVREAANRGCGVLIISEDLDEVIALADRIVVISAGRLVGEHRRGQVDTYEMGREMAGIGGGQP